MRAGIIAGSVAAVAAVALSLPLHAPSDTLFNSASVAAGALVVGVLAAVLRGAIPPGPTRHRKLAIAWLGLFVAVALVIVAGETQLERMVEFGLPLAALVFAIVGLLTPVIERAPLRGRWPAPAALVVAGALSVARAGQGDGQSGTLSLPAPPQASAQLRTATPTPGTPTPAPTASPPATSTPTPTSTSATSPSPSPSPSPTPSPTAAPVTLAVASAEDVSGVTFVVGEGSEATFTVNEKLSRLPLPNDAVIRTEALSGSIHLDGRPSAIELDLQQLSSDQSRRDRYIRDRMFAREPIATLTFDQLPALPERYSTGDVFEGELTGRLLILGVEHPLTFIVEARLDADALFVLGRTTFTWDEIGVPRPSVPSVQVQDEVRVEVLIAARPTLGGAN
jgi:hypothetical protein